MKALILAALLGVNALAPAPAAVPDYSGAWTLDRARSTDLPPFYAQVQSNGCRWRRRTRGSPWTWRSRAAARSRSGSRSSTRWTAARRPPPRASARTTARWRCPRACAPATATTAGCTSPSPASWRAAARRSATGTEAWALAPDGRTLTVHRVEQMPQGGEMRFDMVFVRG